ncbi:phosphonate C-P lyase system protein PhnH [Oceanobacillus senegalensis]|uniref:phosphonate C-P lyase system protein PhnH n=1 Tax=Oceanobacillus senegalensis TaxID=1936063 RepID=UPI000A3048BA|nr:phosphonate C-P lyase system protein PhnH [Oceanobacillus senegalensis]
MQIDSVHDMQVVYRKLLHSMSRPGTISSLETNVERLNHRLPCNRATFLLALTLFDAEVTFHVLPENQSDVAKKISEYTFARHTSMTEADYVIVLQSAEEDEITSKMKHCKIGSLQDPQESATWLMERKQIEEGRKWNLRGPGIKEQVQLHVDVSEQLWRARKERTKEFPLGIDIIFTDDQAQVVCIPRTTLVKGEAE